ncbi:MAG: single-stranded DNA-binding protein [Candidatus Omnitrophica bacterium]|nr:single-stranded DNA-binding protein [Candidatus Omnitrophota bacterium]
MANLNKVFLIGRLARDPELRYIPSGTAVTTFTVATNRNYTLASGEKREESCFVRVVAWARQAELCGEYLSKGSPVFVEGRLQSRSWETPDGQKRSTIEVVAQNIQFLGKSPKAAGEAADLVESSEGARPAVPGAVSVSSPEDLPDLPPEGDSGEAPF